MCEVVKDIFPGGSDGKESTCNVGDLGLIPGLGRPPGEGIATHSGNLAWRLPIDRGTWWAKVLGCKESDMTERLSTQHSIIGYLEHRGLGKRRKRENGQTLILSTLSFFPQTPGDC